MPSDRSSANSSDILTAISVFIDLIWLLEHRHNLSALNEHKRGERCWITTETYLISAKNLFYLTRLQKKGI